MATKVSQYIYSISEIREAITRLPEQFEEEDIQSVTVTRHGKPVMVILTHERYQQLLETLDSLLETLEVVEDEELMTAFRQGMKDVEAGRVKPWDQVKKEHGWE